jgi:nucleobase:cation symporter-1, NCS1 family
VSTQSRPFAVEQHSIDFIPPEERHGRPSSLFSIWWSSNMQMTTVVTGALALVFGLPFVWALLAIVVGNVLGGFFMAFHSAQGPVIGIPQMIQSRAQFGFFGAILPLVLVVVMYVGFFATSDVLGAQALQAAIPGLPIDVGIVVLTVVAVLLAIWGYDLIHSFERVVAYLVGVAFLLITVTIFTRHLIPAPVYATKGFSWASFLLMISVAATWQITYAPYVADYSRYLPQSTNLSSTLWYTYAGSVIASVWMMALGALLAAAMPKQMGNAVATVAHLAGGLGGIMLVLIVLGILAVNVLNLYGGFMSSLTTLGAILRLRHSLASRIGFIVGVAVVGTLFAILGHGNFLNNYSNFILFLSYFLVPWTAINLADFYLVRHGRYDSTAFFSPEGAYGSVRWLAIAAYLIGCLVEVPFMDTTFYTGPISKAMGGADIAWVIGVIVAGGLYILLLGPRLGAETAAGGGRAA